MMKKRLSFWSLVLLAAGTAAISPYSDVPYSSVPVLGYTNNPTALVLSNEQQFQHTVTVTDKDTYERNGSIYVELCSNLNIINKVIRSGTQVGTETNNYNSQSCTRTIVYTIQAQNVGPAPNYVVFTDEFVAVDTESGMCHDENGDLMTCLVRVNGGSGGIGG
jgi:hypothetical protein